MSAEIKAIRIDSFELSGRKGVFSFELADGSRIPLDGSSAEDGNWDYAIARDEAVETSRDMGVPFAEFDHNQWSLVRQAKGIFDEFKN